MWVTVDGLPGSLRKLDSSGTVLQTITVGDNSEFPVFDGKNVWVPNRSSNTITVVRASSGEVLATPSGNGLSAPALAAFDGERIMVTHTSADRVSLWKGTDLTPIGTFRTGAGTDPYGICSDGQYFWITLQGPVQLARF
jgi:DNA-binding beta-propeller fold protein YncE